MIIYKVSPNTEFKLMYPEDDIYDSEEWEFKCNSLAGKLPQFKAYFDKKSDKPLPDIAYIGMSTFAFRKDVATELVDILEAAGELLPFYVDDELWYCFNVLESVDALNDEKTEFKINNGKTKMMPTKYVFDVEKLSESSLFKIPNDNHTLIYCADRRENDKQVLQNFFCAVASNNYTGLKFEEVFTDE